MGPSGSKDLRILTPNFEKNEQFYVFVDASPYVACISFLLHACMTADGAFLNPEYAVLSSERTHK